MVALRIRNSLLQYIYKVNAIQTWEKSAVE